MAVVGIDLGTTNTVVAAVRDGRAAALKDKLGRALLPSVVSLPPKGEPKIGYEGKHRRTLDPENTVFSIKRLIGRSWDSEQVQKARARFPFELHEGPGKATLVRLQGKDFTLPEISALVLGEAKRIAEERLGEPVTDAVITVPANFNDLQRAATKVAGRVAGLQVGRILNEPTAAALAYGFSKAGRQRVVVYDFGGGTFDVTILDLSENVFEVLSTAGDTFLGGDDLDQAIMGRMGEDLKKRHKIDMDQDTLVREQLRAAAEKLKMDLSTRSMSKVVLEEIGFSGGKPVTFDFTMRRSDFETLAEPFIERTLRVCQEALDVAGVGPKELSEILLVGGSTRIPLVRRRLSSFFGKMPQARINPDEVVAIGAAIQAAALESRLTQSHLPAPPIPTSLRPPAGDAAITDLPAITGTTKLGLASAPATSAAGPKGPPVRPLMRTLSGVGDDPRANPRTVTGLGEAPTPEELAKRGAPDPSRPKPSFDEDYDDEGPTARVALSEIAAARADSAVEEGSVSFDLAELEAAATEAEDIEADLPQVRSTNQLERDASQVTEVSGLLELRDEDEDDSGTTDRGESTELDDAELDLPIALPPTDLPSVRGPRAPGPAQLAAPFARLNKTILGTGPAAPAWPATSGREESADLPALSASLPAPAAPAKPEPPPRPRPNEQPGANRRPPPPPREQILAGRTVTGELHGLGLESGPAAPPLERSEPSNPLFDGDGLGGTGANGLPDANDDGELELPPARARMPSLDESIEESLFAEGSIPPQRPLAQGEPEYRTDARPGIQGPSPPARPRAEAAPAPRPPLLIDVTPLALGVETTGGFVDTLIERNSPIPCQRTRTFTTARDNQQIVRVRVSQGDQTRFVENTILGEVELTGLSPGPRGSVLIDVTFSLDESGMLQVAARNQATGQSTSATLLLVGIGEA